MSRQLPFADSESYKPPTDGTVERVYRDTVKISIGTSLLSNVVVAPPLVTDDIDVGDIVAIMWVRDTPYVTSILGQKTQSRELKQRYKAPPAPTNLSILNSANNSTLTWAWGGSIQQRKYLDHYDVDIRPVGGSWGYNSHPVSVGTQEIYYSTVGISIQCRVRAVDMYGNRSSWSVSPSSSPLQASSPLLSDGSVMLTDDWYAGTASITIGDLYTSDTLYMNEARPYSGSLMTFYINSVLALAFEYTASLTGTGIGFSGMGLTAVGLSAYGPTKIVGNGGFIEFENDATLVMHDDAMVWDDIQVSISNVKLPQSSAPEWEYYNFGIVGGVTFPVLAFAVNEYMYFDVQTSHSMKLNTVLGNHVHFTLPATAGSVGDEFKFQLDVIAAGINGQWGIPTGSPYTASHTVAAGDESHHRLLDIADIAASNTTVSSLYKCRLKRVAADSSEYGGDVYINFTDCHYQKDTLGSRLESSK